MTSAAVTKLPGPDDGALVSREQFTQLFRAVPSAVSIVAIAEETGVHATTVSAFTSLSVDPPMVMLALDRRSSLLMLLSEATRFTMNVLSHDQTEHALACATKGPDKLPPVHWRAEGGIALLVGAAAWATCRAERILDGGDHEIVLAVIQDCSVTGDPPLVYHDRGFHRLSRLPG